MLRILFVENNTTRNNQCSCFVFKLFPINCNNYYKNQKSKNDALKSTCDVVPSIKYQLTLEPSSRKSTIKRSKTLSLAVSCREPCTDDQGTTSFWHSTLPIGNSTSFDIISYNISFSSTLVTYEVCGSRPSLCLSLACCVQCIFIRFVFGSKQRIPGPLTPFTRRRQDFAVWLLHVGGWWKWVGKKWKVVQESQEPPAQALLSTWMAQLSSVIKHFGFVFIFMLQNCPRVLPKPELDRATPLQMYSQLGSFSCRLDSTRIGSECCCCWMDLSPRSVLVGCQPAGADVEVKNIWPRLGLPWEINFSPHS